MDERLNEINRELKELNEALARANGLERRLDDLRAQYEERKARVEETARLLTKEREDVEKLEKGGLRALLLSLTGDREARLSQERREELAARLQYDQARRDAEDLEERIRDLLQEREELRAVRTRLEALLGEKAERLKELGGTGGTRLAELDRALDALAAQRREVGEALHAGRQAEQALSGVLDSLDSAESWGTWDMLGGGLFTTMAKHGHIDDARAGIDHAQRALSRFRTELADVRDMELPQVQIGEFATFADYFFDLRRFFHGLDGTVQNPGRPGRRVRGSCPGAQRAAESRADGSEPGGGAGRPEAGAGGPAPQEQRFGLRTGQVRRGCGKRCKTGGADDGGRTGFQTETLPLLRGRDRAWLPVRLPPVGDLLASPVPEPAESFFLQAEHREERGLSPGQRAGVLVPHPARA